MAEILQHIPENVWILRKIRVFKIILLWPSLALNAFNFIYNCQYWFVTGVFWIIDFQL